MAARGLCPRRSTKAPTAVDVFNNCTGPGDNPDYASQLKTVVIDKDGVEITGFIHADNYFELYVNGQFVARDSIADDAVQHAASSASGRGIR